MAYTAANLSPHKGATSLDIAESALSALKKRESN